MPEKRLKAAFLIIFYLLFSWVFVYYTMQVPQYAAASLEQLIKGTAERPFQYRILGPWLIKAISSYSHISLRGAEMIFYFLAYFFAFLALRRWLANFLPRWLSDLSPLWLFICSINNLYPRYPWDALTQLFMPLLFNLAYKKRWGWFLFVFAIAMLNRETTYLAILGFTLIELGRVGKSYLRAAAVFVIASAIWLGLKIALEKMFFEQAGAFVQLEFFRNLEYFTGKRCFFDYMINSHLKPLCWIVPLCWLAFLSFANFMWLFIFPKLFNKDKTLLRLAILIPVHIAIVMVFGVIAERRVMAELYPLIIPLALQTFFVNSSQCDRLNPSGKL